MHDKEGPLMDAKGFELVPNGKDAIGVLRMVCGVKVLAHSLVVQQPHTASFRQENTVARSFGRVHGGKLEAEEESLSRVKTDCSLQLLSPQSALSLSLSVF